MPLWQRPLTQAPSSQSVSVAQSRRAQPWLSRSLAVGLQSKFAPQDTPLLSQRSVMGSHLPQWPVQYSVAPQNMS